MRLTYADGRTGLTTTAFRYKLTDDDGVLVKDWTTGATWTEEPAGTYYLDDEDAVAGTVYAVEPAEDEVGATGRVPLDTTLATEAKQDAAKTVIDGISAQTDNLGFGTIIGGPWPTPLYTYPLLVSDNVRAAMESEATDALNAYDPPKRSEATSDKNAVIAAIPSDYATATAIAAAKLVIDDILALMGTPASTTVSQDIGILLGQTDDLESRLTATRAGYLDLLADIDPAITLLLKHVLNKLVQTDNHDGTWTIELMDDDGTTVLKTWTYTEATSTRSEAV